MTHKFETLLYAILFTVWIVRLYYKLYDKKTRKYILSIGLLIIFWMMIRISKSVVGVNELERYCWYLYYLPLIFIPALFYICCSKGNSKVFKFLIYLVSSILLFFVLTNDLHQIVFSFNNTLSDYDNYTHNIGYYLISLWIFYLFGGGLVKLAINRFKIKRDKKVFLPLIVLLIAILYTVLYVLNFKYIRDINMSIANSVLICLGIELALYLDLIPNNDKYIKTFENSNLQMAVLSLDTKTSYKTKALKEIPKNIIMDILNNRVHTSYNENYILYNIKRNSDSYVIEQNNLEVLNRLKEVTHRKQEQLLKQQERIKLEEKTKKELYEVKFRKEVVVNIEKTLNEKIIDAKKILEKKEVTNEDLEQIKRIIIYCKKKTNIVISSLNDEMFNDKNISLLLNELITSMNLDIEKFIVVQNNLIINGNMMSMIYDIVYEISLFNRSNTLMIYITRDNDNLKIKVCISDINSVKSKLKLDKTIKIKETIYDKDTELLFTIKEGA